MLRSGDLAPPCLPLAVSTGETHMITGGGMTRPTRTKEQLRQSILSQIKGQAVCPPGMDVVVRADKDLRWTADPKPPSPPSIVSADCADLVNKVVRRLRLEYDLAQ